MSKTIADQLHEQVEELREQTTLTFNSPRNLAEMTGHLPSGTEIKFSVAPGGCLAILMGGGCAVLTTDDAVKLRNYLAIYEETAE